ncbi:MAG TPA: hypothetical protein VFH70_01630, partial [Acidimicrobiales bacterium]|nr:hypothetical protein [Acidimicrobiales bacterium]
IGAVAALAVAAGLSLRWGRAAVRVSGALMLLCLPLYVVQQQVSHRYWPSIDWPGQLSSANDIAWLALALVGSDLVVGAVYARRLMAGTR